MRPLKLTISAFASYAGRVELDMKKLGTNGIYLITGDTGSGKTTIFGPQYFRILPAWGYDFYFRTTILPGY